MREQCNLRNICIFIVITMCLVSMMSPAMTQSSNVMPSTPLYMYGPVFHENNIFCESLIVYESTKGFSKSTENEIYNLTVLVDPENRVKESDEGNNEEKKMMGPDLTFAFPEITFLNKKGNEVGSDKLIARESHTIRVNVKNAGYIAAADFYVKLYVNKSYNATYDKQIPGFPMSEQITRLEPGKRSKVDFSWTPQEEGFFRVKVTVDENNDVTEIREDNNVFCCSDEVKVGKPGYRAKSDPLPIYKHGTLNGGIIYEPYCHYVCLDPNTNKSYDYPPHEFGIIIPQKAEIVVARLYLYVWGDKPDREHPGFRIACLPELKITFNGEEIKTGPTTYEDTSGATAENYNYAIYCYDVMSACNGKKWRAEAHFTRKEEMRVGINGMALLVVYQDSNSVLTSYWIGEGSDVLMAKNLNFPTGFEFEECTRKCVFEAVGDAQVANASLLTVLTPYTSYDATKLLPEAGGEGDLLRFGQQEVANLMGDTTGHWAYREPRKIAFTENEWEYVYVKDGTNIAEIQSRGNYFVLKHAILKVEYLPELVAPYIPKSVVVGLPITVAIENKGKSKAGKFNVSFYVDGVLKEKKQFGGIPGESREEWTLPWTPYRVGQLARLNISVDCDNDVRELNENNNNVSQLVAVVDSDIKPNFDTGSSDNPYPSISGIHKGMGIINSTSFVDANARSYNNRIPAIRLEGNFANDNLPDLEVNEIDIANVTNVTLFSVVNWGFQTDLWFNGHLLGKDCFTSIHPYQEEIAQYNVTMIPAEYLNSTYNLVEMEFRGNCKNMPANAFLVVEYKKDER